MKWTSTLAGLTKWSVVTFAAFIAITLLGLNSYAQTKNYATTTPSSGLVAYYTFLGNPTTNTNPGAQAGSVTSPGNAAINDNTAATLTANYSNILGLATGEGEAWLQLKYPTVISGGKTSYIRFDQPTTGGGLSLDLLQIVGNLTGLLSSNLVQLDVYSGANENSNGTIVSAASVSSTVVKDAAGANYFAVTPTVDYNSIRIRLRFRGNLLGLALNSNVNMRVYNSFNVDAENCAPSIFATTGEASGVNVTLTQLVQNPQFAIDNSVATFSQLQAGVVGLGSRVSQTIYLNGLSTADDYAKAFLSLPASILNVNLLNTITLQAYNGNTPVGTPRAVSSLLSLDLLGLLANATITPVFFKPGAPFDRVRISIDNTLAVGGNLLSGGINIHEVQRTVEPPSFAGLTNGAASFCGNQVSLAVNNPNPAYTYNWYRSTGTSTTRVAVATAAGATFTESNLAPGQYTYYLSAQKIGCIGESDVAAASVTVVAIPASPTANAPAICSGSTATLSIVSPIPGNTYRWYADATGTTVLFTGANFTTPILNANTTYYVESVTGTCVSASRTAVSVVVNPLPNAAVVSTNNETISSGQTAVLAATTDAGNTISWYAAAAGGSPLATGPTFTTPTLTATTTYYVETRSATGCLSSSRVPVTVTVTSSPVNPACNAAVAQQSGITGLLCVACNIQDAGNSTDTDLNNFTRINLAVGVGAIGYQRLIFANPGAITDSIRLDLETPTGLADLGVLGGITIRVLNGTNQVASYPLNSSLLRLGLLTGNRFKVTLPAGGVYDRVEVRFGATVTALSSLNIYGAEVIYPNPTVANTGLEACSGSSTTLSASANGGTTLRWFANALGGTALATGESFTTGALTGTTTYYIEVSKGTCANVTRVPVTVTVNPAIVFTGTTLTNATVAAAYSKQLGPATGGTPGFTYALAPGSSLPAGLTLSPAGVIGGTPTAAQNVTFSVIATDSKGCSATAAFSLEVRPALALPAATLPNGLVGSPYPTQTLPAATGGTTPFTYTAGNLPPGLSFNPTSREITGTPTQAGTYTIPVIATDANGNTISRDYTIVVRNPLLLPTATLAEGTVGTTYQTQTIPSATGGNGPYIYASTGTLPPGLSFNPATQEITGTPTQVGTFSFPIRVTDADGTVVTTNYSIKVNDPLVLAGKNLTDGTVGTVYPTETLPAATGGTGPYTYVGNNLPPGLAFNATTRQITGTPTQSGTFNVSVSVTDAVGATVTQNYSLKVNGVLSLPMATLPNGLVGTSYPTQTLPAVSGGTAPYTYVATGLPPGLTFDPTSRQITGTPTTGGTYNITLKATDNTGLSTSTDYPLVVNVGAPVVASATTCSGATATLAVSSPISGLTYNWYGASGNTILFTGTSYTTTPLTANTTYYVEAVSGTAVSSRTAVNVTINPPATAATILSNNETISAGQTATLRASADAGNTIRWYAAASGGPALATGASFTTPALSANTTYYVETQNASGCLSASRVPVTVTVTAGPVNPNCNAAVAQQSGIDGICLLCSVQTPGGSTDSDPNTFTRINLAVGVGSTGYQRLIFASPGTATDSIRLDLATPVGLADLGVLSNVTVTVMNGTTVVGTYPLNSPLLDLKLLTGNRFKATVPAGGIYDRVEIRFGALVSAISNLNIYGAEVVYPNPTIATAGLSICSGSSTTINATANGGTALRWFASPNSGTVLASGNTFSTGVLTTTTTYYIEVSAACFTNFNVICGCSRQYPC